MTSLAIPKKALRVVKYTIITFFKQPKNKVTHLINVSKLWLVCWSLVQFLGVNKLFSNMT